MTADFSRRRMMQVIGSAAFLSSVTSATGGTGSGMQSEDHDTPKICLEIGDGRLAAGGLSEAGMRRVKQLGVDHVLAGGPRIPWQESEIRSIMDRLKAGGLSLGNMMIYGFPNTLYGRPGTRRSRRSSSRSRPRDVPACL